MTLIDYIRRQAAANPRTIVLAESEDKRTFEALDHILDDGIANIILIGPENVRKNVVSKKTSGLQIVDPMKFKDIEKMINEYYELRKAKGITIDEAAKIIKTDYVTFGAMLVRWGLAAGFVAGASHTTADIIRAALRCLAVDKNIGVVSGSFLMEVPNSPYGENGAFLFADCGVNPEPNARQLAGIALSSAELFRKLTAKTPVVAFLSYSSKGSAEGPLVDRVREALSRVKDAAPNLLCDGEFQVDSAIVPEVAAIKCPGNNVAGKANVLIFPDLNSGNISYKLVQRLANARAIGPLLQGFTKPCSDLSRGCIPEDIVDAVAVTSIRAS